MDSDGSIIDGQPDNIWWGTVTLGSDFWELWTIVHRQQCCCANMVTPPGSNVMLIQTADPDSTDQTQGQHPRQGCTTLYPITPIQVSAFKCSHLQGLSLGHHMCCVLSNTVDNDDDNKTLVLGKGSWTHAKGVIIVHTTEGFPSAFDIHGFLY